MLEADRLECVRGDRTLFRGLSFSVAPTQLLHLAGANGSGKTSLLRILCGLLSPAHGEIRWDGHPIASASLREEYAARLLYIGHANALKDELTALENLEIGGTLAGRQCTPKAALDALDELGVGRCAHLPVRALSQGQRRRVSLARLALRSMDAGNENGARLWILDEPFAALDTAAVAHLEHLIFRHVTAGGMAVLTTHQPLGIAMVGMFRIELEYEMEPAP
jgi:heme exporter protein A